MIHVTCRLTAKNRDQILHSVIEYGLPLPLLSLKADAYITFIPVVSETVTVAFLSVVDLSFVQFFGDDFLRVLLLRYVFCYVTLRLHKAFRVSSRGDCLLLCLCC